MSDISELMSKACDEINQLRAELSNEAECRREHAIRADAAEAERDALQARIDGAANVTARVGYHGGCMLYGPEELAGKRIALVQLDD